MGTDTLPRSYTPQWVQISRDIPPLARPIPPVLARTLTLDQLSNLDHDLIHMWREFHHMAATWPATSPLLQLVNRHSAAQKSFDQPTYPTSSNPFSI